MLHAASCTVVVCCTLHAAWWQLHGLLFTWRKTTTSGSLPSAGATPAAMYTLGAGWRLHA
jgi:hypothetical protein